ncbi:MAG: UvrD-helicase domain-containing protein [Solirubrobacteraceae bacterium]
MISTREAFDVLGPLPTGVAVLEASAGTGKTYTIAALAARYVADGVPLEQLLIVTFTRMATSELRERVRERLVSAERALHDVVAGAPPPAQDALAVLLATGTPEQVRARRRHLARAVADFDAATITTTHGFCLEALGSLGFAGDIERDCTFSEDVRDLIDEVVDDLYVRRFRKYARRLTRTQAHQIATKAIANAAAHLEPSPAAGDSDPAMRARLAVAARAELERRKRLASVMTYDDLLTRLDATLADAAAGADVATRLRARYSVVLVDEFQDTDPVQWSIMRRAFAHPGGTLVLIGDPKQAIYAFRGADVYAYLEAAAAAGIGATLSVNWRSDQRLLTAYDQLFGSAQLGHPGIVYRPVRATGEHQAPRLLDAPVDVPLRVRIVDRSDPAVGQTQKKYARKDSARLHIARDLADDVVALLSSTAQIAVAQADGPATHARVRPGDVAVLVRRNRDAATVRDALEAVGVPAVINGAGSVFASPSARHWLQLLEALERPTAATRARAAALTPFLGWTASAVVAADEDAWEQVHQGLHHWAHVLRVNGVASLLETITLRRRLPERILSVPAGERELTDLRHIGQLLHAAATADDLGTAALTAWLRRRIAESGSEADEERSLRLESDAAAVQVLTIHRSKGLEFGIVYYPYLWDPSWIPDDPEPVFFHDPEHADRRTLDVALEGSAYAVHRQQQRDELRGEDLRLAYVALTRARHQAVIWWAGAWGAQDSALGRLVFSQGADGAVPTAGDGVPTDAAARARFEELAAGAPGCISVESATPTALPRGWSDALDADVTLSAATFDREIDRVWRRTSYSDMTAFGREASVASEPETRLLDDEDEDGTAAAGAGDEPDFSLDHLKTAPSLLAEMPGGVQIGTLVHDLFEATDFAAADLRGELADRLREQRARRPLEVGDAAAVVDGLTAALRTPLGPLLGDRPLSSVAASDRIDEMAFELPLAGGERSAAAAALTPRSIARVLRDHLDPGDALHGYAERLADPDLRARVRGYLTGSIDLVLRVPGADGRARYAIADYKTNRLGDQAVPLTAWDHRPDALRSVMYHAHYALQGLLYTVALHRYLRWRLPDYDPDRDIAGVFYLFLRGMAGPDTPRVDGTPCGVFAWRPPGPLVCALSDLLDRGAQS